MLEVVGLGAQAPLGCLRARLRASSPRSVRCLMLRCQVLVAAERRSYDSQEEAALADLFGPPELWGKSLRSLLWTQTSLTFPPFEGTTECDLDLPVTWEENQACAVYFEAIRQGTVPIRFLFAGSIFYLGPAGQLQVEPLAPDCAAYWPLAVDSCRQVRQNCFSGKLPVLLARDLFRRLSSFGRSRGRVGVEKAIELLLEESGSPGSKAL